jgi:hypothetical protein
MERDRVLQEIHSLAARETAAIRRWKRVLLFILFASAIFVAVGAYIVLRREEKSNYQDAVSHSYARVC